MSSVGSVATRIFGGLSGAGLVDAAGLVDPSCLVDASSWGGISLAISSGGLSIGVQGPLGSLAVYQNFPPLRKQAPPFFCRITAKVVLTTCSSSEFGIARARGSPS